MERIFFLLALPLISVFTSTALATFRAYNASPRVQAQTDQKKKQKKQIDSDENLLPVVDFNAPESFDPEKLQRRKKHSKKYDFSAMAVGDVTQPETRIAHINETYMKDALPIDTAPVIVVAEVTEAEAVLSGDKSGVYTEFTLLIQDVLKDDSQLKVGDVITAEREGGKVRLPSGQIVPVFVTGIRMPKVRERYLLFLYKHPIDQAIGIYTGYRLSGDTVTALDYYERTQVYNGASVDKLLGDLKASLAAATTN